MTKICLLYPGKKLLNVNNCTIICVQDKINIKLNLIENIVETSDNCRQLNHVFDESVYYCDAIID